ncbi:hypothetical protein V6N11_071489 [Hibiscus sabdariffa]|uniref:Cyclin-dependent kinases regulatory subunit n=1 Tax=Hibiscus sabdariffa TaxID=183260 RepID=A0ABR2U076_9ROSI
MDVIVRTQDMRGGRVVQAHTHVVPAMGVDTIANCGHCKRRHLGECWVKMDVWKRCGSMEHLQRDCHGVGDGLNRKKEMGQIQYSEKYFDDTYEYRHVVLPPEVAKLLPKNRLLSEILVHSGIVE